MTADDLAFLPLSEQAVRIGSEELSPVEPTESYLERIGRFEDTLKAFITALADEAAARAAGGRGGDPGG
jgi:Asp-tRNA(Asn)/Glu-tRNA(Gln) amidotransferase A subunit family amidase